MEGSVENPSQITFVKPTSTIDETTPKNEARTPNATPISFETVVSSTRQVKSESSGYIEFLFIVTFVLLRAFGIVVPLTMTVIGLFNFRNCPIQSFIPIYLLVGGLFGALEFFKNLFLRFIGQDNKAKLCQDASAFIFWMNFLLRSFLIAWFVAGSVWVYRVYQPDFENDKSDQYCDKVMYLFAFWLITICYILLGLFVVFLCSTGVLAVLCSCFILNVHSCRIK